MKQGILFILFSIVIPALWAQDGAGRFEASFFGADVHVPGSDHGTYGGNAGFEIRSKTMLFGEVSRSYFGGPDLVDLSGGLKYTLLKRDKVEPYTLVAIGVGQSDSNSLERGRAADFGLHAGGGVRWYVGKHWGVQPEIRWTHYFRNDSDLNIVRYSGGLFVRWGTR